MYMGAIWFTVDPLPRQNSLIERIQRHSSFLFRILCPYSTLVGKWTSSEIAHWSSLPQPRSPTVKLSGH